MTYVTQFFTDLHRLIEAIAAPMRNHAALVDSSLQLLDSRIDDLSRSLDFYRDADGKMTRALADLSGKEGRLTEMAKESVLAGERKRALTMLLKARHLSRSRDEVMRQLDASATAQKTLGESLGALRKIRKDFADRRLQASGIASEENEVGIPVTVNARVLDVLRMSANPDLNVIYSLTQTNEDLDLTAAERTELEEELDRLLREG